MTSMNSSQCWYVTAPLEKLDSLLILLAKNLCLSSFHKNTQRLL
jgi:hypothetical protein